MQEHNNLHVIITKLLKAIVDMSYNLSFHLSSPPEISQTFLQQEQEKF